DGPGVRGPARPRRKAHRRPDARRPGLVNMTMIEQRPAEAAGRSQPGHWEGDLITGAHNRSAIGTLVERATRFTILLHQAGIRPRRSAMLSSPRSAGYRPGCAGR